MANGDLLIQIWTFIPDPAAVTQVLYGLRFNMSGVGGNSFSFAGTGNLISINSDRSYTSQGTNQPIASSTLWSATTTLSDSTAQVSLTALAAQPDYGIIGNTGVNSVYDGANSSLLNGAHNPFVLETATFTLRGLTGITSTDIVSNVLFSFGTTAGALEAAASSIANRAAVVAAVPEPASWALGLTGLFGMLALRRRRGSRGTR